MEFIEWGRFASDLGGRTERGPKSTFSMWRISGAHMKGKVGPHGHAVMVTDKDKH